MPEAAVATAAEAAMAESFAAAAPELFIPEAAMGAEFGTAAAFDALGAGALGLEGLGMMGLEGISAAAPSLGQAVTEGIVSGGAGAGATGINEAMLAQQQANAVQAANSGIQQALETARPLTDAQYNFLHSSVADASGNILPSQEFIPESAISEQGAMNNQIIDRFANTTSQNFPAKAPDFVQSAMNNPAAQAGSAMNAPYIPGWTPEKELLSQVPGGRLVPAQTGSTVPTESEGIMGAFNKAVNWAKENPWSAASMGMNAMRFLGGGKDSGSGGPEPYTGILTKYKLSPDFKGRYARPEDYQYTPRRYAGGGPVEMMSNANSVGANTGYPMADISKGAYATPWQTPISRNVLSGAADTGVNPMTGQMTNFATGGIASYKSGGEAAMDYYERMTQAPKRQATGATEPHAGHGDVGIYYDLDPDTRYLDPVTAAQVRMSKINKRAGMQLAGMKRPTPMGQLNLVPVTMKGNPTSVDTTEAARGGIMSLGGYAAGGNPRLLKGPGDGMSDDIPATIANKQPARLADGEFVVPADVVSHLGNGSTDAGAKKLHKMMTNVRKARTGNPKQGKQINPNKYIPT